MSELKINSMDKPDVEYVGLTTKDRATLRRAATEFESIMLKELLKSTNSKETRGMFGGGMAEEFFADHLNDERAKAIAESGGLGVGALIEQEILESYKSRLKPGQDASDKVSGAIAQLNARKGYAGDND